MFSVLLAESIKSVHSTKPVLLSLVAVAAAVTSYIYLLNLPPWTEVIEVKKSRNLFQNKASGGNFPDSEPGLGYYRVQV